MNTQNCTKCKGGRLKEESLSVYINHNNIFTLCRKSINELLSYFNTLQLAEYQIEIASGNHFA